MNRREFTKNVLLGAGELALLNSSRKLFAATGLSDDHATAEGTVSIQVGKRVEITRSFHRCWFPGLQQFPNKDLMVTMSMGADEVNPEGGFGAYCVSKDNGETWSPRYTIGGGAAGLWLPDPGSDGILDIGGRSIPVSPGNTQDFHWNLTRFSDSGMKIEERRNIARLHMSEPILLEKPKTYDRHVQDAHMVEIGNCTPGGPILTSNTGALIGSVYYKSERDPKYYRLACIHSDDHGESWHQGTVIAAIEQEAKPWPGMGNEGPCEANMARLRDGRIFVIFRTGDNGFMGTAWSSDEGKSWTPPTLIPFKGVWPQVRLLSNGILACTTGRPGPVVLMLSLDGTGKSWSHVTPIFSGMSTRYTDFLEIARGKLFVVYDSTPYGWEEIPLADQTSQNVIYGTYLDIEFS